MKKLYTTLIVEDEDIVREGLIETIEWEKIGFSVTAQASGGREALRKFQTEPTDVVLTDIRMPEFDGIQLLKAIKEQHIETQVVFISSYAEFEYAKQAITYKAFSYVIKTELFEDLEKVLHELYLFLEKQEFEREQLPKKSNRKPIFVQGDSNRKLGGIAAKRHMASDDCDFAIPGKKHYAPNWI